MKKILFISTLLLVFISCQKLFIEDDPKNTQLNNFEILWNDFDENYAAFTVRDINWEAIKTEATNHINSGLTEQEFFEMMSSIIVSFKDIHVQLIKGNDIIRYNSRNPNSSYFKDIAKPYLINETKIKNTISYAAITGTDLGYISIPRFGGPAEEFKVIDEIIEKLKTKKGIIIDVRSNGGGKSNNPNIIASRFIDEPFVHIRYKYRNGPAHDDFTDWLEDSIKPEGDQQYTKPIAVLTDSESASATEWFTQTLRGLPHVTIIGDTTAGGLGTNMYRELPNGWTYRMTVWLQADKNGEIFEGRGIPPDFPVLISEQDSINGIDTQLEKAIELLN